MVQCFTRFWYGDTKKMSQKYNLGRGEYDNYPVPNKVIPLTDENRKEYSIACEKARKAAREVLKDARQRKSTDEN